MKQSNTIHGGAVSHHSEFQPSRDRRTLTNASALAGKKKTYRSIFRASSIGYTRSIKWKFAAYSDLGKLNKYDSAYEQTTSRRMVMGLLRKAPRGRSTVWRLSYHSPLIGGDHA